MKGSEFDFDFEHWSDLAQRDPSAFFAARQRIIDDFIASAPAQHFDRLTALQNRIDCSRIEAGTPSKALRVLMAMLSDHLDALQNQLVQLNLHSKQLASTLEDPPR